MAKIIIERIAQWDGHLSTFKVYHNDKLISKMSTSDVFEIELDKGQHKLQIKAFLLRSKPIEINVNPETPDINLTTGIFRTSFLDNLSGQALKLLPKDEFFESYKGDTDTEFKKQVKHHPHIVVSGLLASAIILFLVFQHPNIFDDRDLVFLLAISMGLGTIYFMKRKWILAKWFFMYTPLVDAFCMLLIALQINNQNYQILVALMAIPFFALWLYIRNYYKDFKPKQEPLS